MPYRDAPPDSEPLVEVCLECFHARHDGECPECHVHCKARRRWRLATGTLRVLYAVFVLLFAIAIVFVGLFAFEEGLARLVHWFGLPGAVVLAVLTLVLRWKRSQYLAEAPGSKDGG